MVHEQTSGEIPHDGSNTAPMDHLLTVGEDEFLAAFGESVAHTLDINTWHVGEDLAAMYQTLEQEITAAVEQESHMRERIRAELFPLVFQHPEAPPQANCYQVDTAMLERVHRGLLFNGSVEACDGTSMSGNPRRDGKPLQTQIDELVDVSVPQVGIPDGMASLT